jgi:uncharacterized membrane protein YfcA
VPDLVLDPSAWLLIALAGFAAGFIDSIAGGGGMISLPALLTAGLPPHLALGTNKLQSALGTSFSTANYASRRLVMADGLAVGIPATALAAFAGAWLVTRMSADLLVRTIPWLLIAIFVFVLLAPKLGVQRGRARMGSAGFYCAFGLLLGFYDGFFGPGTGTFWTFGFLLLLGYTLPHATGQTKTVNLTSNVASLVWFAWHGEVAWLLGLAMGSANVCGALVGSSLAIKRGAGFIRVCFLAVVGATILRLLWRAWFAPG